MKHRCPICQAVTDSDVHADFPFCSERCRLIDLGAWLSEQRAIPGESAPAPENSVTEEREPKRET